MSSSQAADPTPTRPRRSRAAGPLVSVIVPVLNGEHHLAQSLDSILAQTYGRIEVIVMDDASTDATAEIIADYGDRVRHHRQPSAQGIYANVNTGLVLARGELIATYHADDIYRPEIVERQVQFLARHPDAGAVFCKDIFIDAEGRPFGALELPPDLHYDAPLGYRTILNALLEYKNTLLRCPSAMVRASVYAELGGYDQDRFRNTSDLEMWLRIARHHPLGILDEPLFHYRRGHGSSSERYHRLRTVPERFFAIMDLELERAGCPIVAPEILRSYEAHRAQDSLEVAAANYITGHPARMRTLLASVGIRQILVGRHVRRERLLVLYAVLRLISTLPRLRPVARWLSRHLSGG